jgi:antitoxin component YwqK of YwqJK toxin-antitoxin module
MARRVRFRASAPCLLIWVLWFGCTSSEERVNARMLNSSEPGVEQVNGTVLLHDKPYTGTIFTLYPGTQDTARIVRYLVGKEHGTWKQFYPGGHLQDQREFDRGRKVGQLLAWWENGNKKMHYHFENDEYEGTCREWNSEGQLVLEMNYHQGHEQGAQKMYYDNGKIRANYTIVNGRRYGLLGTKNCINVADSVFKM